MTRPHDLARLAATPIVSAVLRARARQIGPDTSVIDLDPVECFAVESAVLEGVREILAHLQLDAATMLAVQAALDDAAHRWLADSPDERPTPVVSPFAQAARARAKRGPRGAW